MSFRDILAKIEQLNATNEVVNEVEDKVYRHKGTYGTSYGGDDDGKKAPPAVKRGRGRPRKDADPESGEVKKYDTAKLQSWIVGNKPKVLPGKPSVKHKLKDWMEYVERSQLTEGELDEGKMKDLMVSDAESMGLDEFCGRYGNDEFVKEFWHDINDGSGEGKLDEIALDQSQVAAPQVKAAGMQQPAGTTQPQQVGQTSKPQIGAAIIDFKNPQDPLKAAIQQAVKNKQVTVMATEGQINESMEPVQEKVINKLERLLANYPYEHKMAQEGWGMHESLYQALCDHFWEEGKIPREKMYGDGQSLRDWVEECYLKETHGTPGVDEGVLGTLGGAALGGLIAGPVGAAVGAVGGQELTKGGSSLVELDNELDEELFSNNMPTMEDTMDESKLDEKYMGHKKLSGQLEKKGAEDPEALASWIGRKKYGKEKFQKAAAAGKKLGEEQLGEEEQVDEKAVSKAQQRFMGMVHAVQKGEMKAPSEKVGKAAKTMTKKAGHEYAATKHKDLPEKVKESDAQMEAWDKQLGELLNEGVTITTSMGNEGGQDNVSVSASGAEAHDLLKLIQSAGLGREKSAAMSTPSQDTEAVTVQPASPDEVMGTLEPADDGEEAFGFIKRMIGARQGHAGADHSHADYEAEEGSVCETCGCAECECEGQEVAEMDNYEETQHSSSDHSMSPVPEEEEMDEGNLFTGNLAKARAAGKKEADLDGDGDMEKVKEELKGGQKELDVAEPKGKLTAADFAKLRAKGDGKVEEEALDQPATMEASAWEGTGETDLAAAVAQNGNAEEDAETEKETAMSEGEETCNECGGLMEEGHKCTEELTEWANSPAGSSKDESFIADLEFMTKAISGGLNNIKQDQTVVPSARVKTAAEQQDESLSMAEMLKRLSGIN